MSDAGDLAELRVRLHERESHSELAATVAALRGMLDEACARVDELQAELDGHRETYHAPEPVPEPEPPEPEPVPEPEPPGPEPEPEPAPPP